MAGSPAWDTGGVARKKEASLLKAMIQARQKKSTGGESGSFFMLTPARNEGEWVSGPDALRRGWR